MTVAAGVMLLAELLFLAGGYISGGICRINQIWIVGVTQF